MRLRLYAVTGRSKIHAVALCVLIIAELISGLWFTAVTGMRPGESLDPSQVFWYESHGYR
jgi:hypothetical protein